MEALLLRLLVMLARLLYRALSAGVSALTEGEVQLPPLKGDGAETASSDAHVGEVDVERLRGRLATLESRVQAVPGIGAALGEALQTHEAQEIARIEALSAEGQAMEAWQASIALQRRWTSISRVVELRSDARGAYLADAETLAEAFLRPFANLARTEGLAFVQQTPICVPARPEEEAIWMGLLPNYPVLFVPSDFGENIYRWASLPHEIGHLLVRRVPFFEDEIRARLELPRRLGLINVSDGREVDLRVPFASWIDEMVADTFAMLMMGPSALRGFVDAFQAPDEVEAVQWAGFDGVKYAPHPPAHLRVLMAAGLLRHIGYDLEAAPILRSWLELHPSAEHVFVPVLPGGAVSIPSETMAEIGTELLIKIYQGGYRSLAGRELRSIHGLELSPGDWARAQAWVPSLLEGDAVRTDDARAVLVAAIEAYAAEPGRRAAISQAVRATILGRGLNERRASDPRYRTESAFKDAGESPYGRAVGEGRRRLGADDVRAAIVLHELLAPAHRRGRARGLSTHP